MITFTWEYTTGQSGRSYISWDAKWDGRWDNDELISEDELTDEPYTCFHHPFEQTIDYEQSLTSYNRYKNMSDEEKKKDFIIGVIQDDGSIREENWGNNENVNPEHFNPKNLLTCGDTVAVNSVTRALCEILSDPEKIKMSCGNTHPYAYRSNLLGCLSRLWD